MEKPMALTYAVCDKCGQMNRVELKTNKKIVCGACQSELPLHGAVIDGSDQSFQKLISKCPLPVVVDIWASWCGPCRAFAPTFKEAGDKFAGKIVFVKLDSEKNPRSASQLNIRSIPTVLVFKDGKEIARQSGAMPSDQFNQWLNENANTG
jgi:thioredoxin 2